MNENKDYRKFFITGDARSGSNMLVTALDSHPQIRCFREVFQFWSEVIDYHVAGFDEHNPHDLQLRNEDPCRFLNERIFTVQPPDVAAVGFKYLYQHFWGFEKLTDGLSRDRTLHVIHLKRRNTLRGLVSAKLAEATGIWFQEARPKKRPLIRRVGAALRDPVRGARSVRERLAQRPKPKITLTVQQCEEWFNRVEWERSRNDSLFGGHPMMDVWYEDLSSGTQETLLRVQQFLAVEPRTLEVSLRKQNPEPLEELIANYDEICARLAGSPMAVYFDE